jgi:translation initiation factor IF-1
MNDDRDKMEVEGTVIDCNNGKFKVQVNENYIVLCTLSGKIRINSVRILLGDKVRIEIGAYDTSKGRIVFRIKAG